MRLDLLRSRVPAGLAVSFALAVLVAFFALVGVAAAGFGFKPGAEGFDTVFLNQDGSPDVQAGSHPWAMSVHFAFNTTSVGGEVVPDGMAKDLRLVLAPGMAGDPGAIGRCTMKQFYTAPSGPLPSGSSLELSGTDCPDSSQVGVAELDIGSPIGRGVFSFAVYNLEPPAGVPAALGLRVLRTPPIVFDASLAGGAGDPLALSLANLNQVEPLFAGSVTVWGVPGDPSHDALRGRCLGAKGESVQEFPHQCAVQGAPAPFLSMPTSCGAGALTMNILGDSWLSPGRVDAAGAPDPSDPNWVGALARLPGLEGCESLSFGPQLAVQSETSAADSPSGLTVDLRAPQNEDPNGLARAQLKKVVLSLPVGWSISPSVTDGLQACTPAQIGSEGVDPHTREALFSQAPAQCPEYSKLGLVEIQTPISPALLMGGIYLAQPYENPFSEPGHSSGSLLALYLVAEGSGVIVKLPAQLQADPLTGRLTATLDGLPQQPFDDLKLTLFGGSRAVLATPDGCGTLPVEAALTPYSSQAPTTLSSPLAIASGCAASFSPFFLAGTTSIEGGAYSPFTLTLSRTDEEQQLAAVALTTPPGLLAMVSKVPECPPVQASLGTCSPASEVGHVTLAVGPGRYPAFLPRSGEPRDPIYLTGPYGGAPFGLSIVVRARAGPLDLGTVVLRAAIGVDPRTAALTIASAPLPAILDGIPLRIRLVNLTFDRAGFILNPTNCGPLLVAARIAGAQGASASVSSRFQVASCAALPFHPRLSALTYANGQLAGHGAYLHVRIAMAPGQANMRSLKLNLPQRLPARLETIQHACPERVFGANPAACPRASLIGSATALTPVLGAPMRGPVYLVSHGGASFPDMVLVLQAQGVTIDLLGALYVDDHNITSTTFRSIPDVPIARLDLILPEGPRSALAAGGDLCSKPLHISSAIVAQNNVRVKHAARVGVKGCRPAKSRPSAHPQKRRR